jgi:hypothetical protein
MLMNFMPKKITKKSPLRGTYNRIKYDNTRVLVATFDGTKRYDSQLFFKVDRLKKLASFYDSIFKNLF